MILKTTKYKLLCNSYLLVIINAARGIDVMICPLIIGSIGRRTDQGSHSKEEDILSRNI